MFKALIKGNTSIVVCLILGGCATKFTQVNLVPTGITRTQAPFEIENKSTTVVIADPSAQTGEVRLDATFPPAWKDALQNAIDQAGVFKDDAARKVTVSAVIKKFKYNPTGFSNTLEVEVSYSVTDRSNGQRLFEKDVVNSASASAKETWNPTERVIKLWNKATQDNIKAFVEALKQGELQKTMKGQTES